MSLYDGLGVESNQNKATNWSAGFQMLKTQLEVRKATLTKAKNERARPSTMAPVIDFNRLRQEEEDTSETKQSVFLGGEILEKFFDEYDPAHPNDYDKLAKSTNREKEKLAEKDRNLRSEREIEERRKRRAQRHAQQGLTGESSLVSRDYEAEELEYEKSKQARSATKAAIAPPSILMESDNKLLAAPPPPASLLAGGAGVQFAKELKGSVAHKIMSKYGFKEGKGLGKDNRGMSHALQVEKTSKRGGKIISSEQIEEELKKEATEQRSVADLLNSPTKVVCLRNMVGIGEVDDDLQTETSDECGKYGTVVKCLIYEMHNVPDDEAIRIFIEFDRLQAAIKALVDLNGRFFGGRTVKASFYDIDKFKSFVLNDPIP